jgi:hypothetical protein
MAAEMSAPHHRAGTVADGSQGARRPCQPALKTGFATKFLDQAKVHAALSGDGGAGSVSFRERVHRDGGPDGGDGGQAAATSWIEAVDGLNTLIDYRYQQHFKAATGGHGMGRLRPAPSRTTSF